MQIREATIEDVQAIVDISNWAALNTPANFAISPEPVDDWRKSFESTRHMFPWLVAVDGPKVIGFAKASPHRGRCAYNWTAEVSVYVHPAHHGKGVGTDLYSRLIPILNAQGYVTLLAGITTPNPASQRLHESFGFQRIGTYQRVGWKFDRWHDVGYWQLFLRGVDHVPGVIQPVSAVMAIESGSSG